MSTWYSSTITVFPIHFSRKSLNGNYLIQVLLTFEFVGAIVRHGHGHVCMDNLATSDLHWLYSS